MVVRRWVGGGGVGPTGRVPVAVPGVNPTNRKSTVGGGGDVCAGVGQASPKVPFSLERAIGEQGRGSSSGGRYEGSEGGRDGSVACGIVPPPTTTHNHKQHTTHHTPHNTRHTTTTHTTHNNNHNNNHSPLCHLAKRPLAVDMLNVERASAAQRRRGQRLRASLKHERQSIAMALAEKLRTTP